MKLSGEGTIGTPPPLMCVPLLKDSAAACVLKKPRRQSRPRTPGRSPDARRRAD